MKAVAMVSTIPFADDLSITRVVPGLMRLHEWQMSAADLLSWLKAVLAMGITSFDHADIYGGYTNEARFGEALTLEPGLRQQMQLISKCNIQLMTENRPDTRIKHYDTSRAHILRSVDNSLKALRTDYLDLLLIHRPDPLMKADEVAETFVELNQSGKVRYFGVSNFTPAQLELLASRLTLPLVTNQVEISVSHTVALHDGTLDQCQRLKVWPMAWSPLGGGGIFRGDDPQSQRLRDVMSQIANEHDGAGLDQVALAWLFRHPAGIVPVLGTGKLERIRAAADAEQISLTRQQWFRIWQASKGHEVP
jgi:predicted oxidoreductase